MGNLKKLIALTALLTACAASAQERYMHGRNRLMGNRQVYFTVDIKPFSTLNSPHIDGFEATDGVETEEINGTTSSAPYIEAGLTFEMPYAFFDVTAGLGYLSNDAFGGSYRTAGTALKFKLGTYRATFGPRAGIIKFDDPDWDDDADADLHIDGEQGSYFGIGVTFGTHPVSFTAALDYIDAEFDVHGQNGWTTNDDELDISGLRLSVGVVFRF